MATTHEYARGIKADRQRKANQARTELWNLGKEFITLGTRIRDALDGLQHAEIAERELPGLTEQARDLTVRMDKAERLIAWARTDIADTDAWLAANPEA